MKSTCVIDLINWTMSNHHADERIQDRHVLIFKQRTLLDLSWDLYIFVVLWDFYILVVHSHIDSDLEVDHVQRLVIIDLFESSLNEIASDCLTSCRTKCHFVLMWNFDSICNDIVFLYDMIKINVCLWEKCM